jgi:ATP adenylyltransferase
MALNRYPYNNGHLLVVPYAHVPSLEDLSPETLLEMMLLVNTGLATLRQAMDPHGFNVGANLGRPAGAGITAHVHIHIVPRWSGDANFMTTVAETRTIPETLDQTYARLRAALVVLAAQHA